MRNRQNEKRSAKIRAIERKFWRRTGAGTALVLAAAIFATLLGYALGWSTDLTTGGIFTLTQSSRELIGSLSQPVKIGAVYAAGNEDAMVKALLERYDAASEYISVEFLDAQATPALLADYDLGGAQTVANGTLIINSGSRCQLLNDDDMYVNGNAGNIFYGEQDITGAIKRVTTDDLPVVYISAGHGETAVSELSQAVSILENQVYEVRQLVMLQTDIPQDAALIIIPSPETDLSEYEYGLLSEYMKNGGRLLLLLDPVLTADSAPLTYFAALAAEYGLDITNNYVIESSDSYHLTTSQLYLIPRYGDHEIVKPLAANEQLVVLPIALGIGTLEHDEGSISQTALLASSTQSRARYDLESQSAEAIESDGDGPVTLAYAVTKSSGKTGVDQSRLVVIGDGSFAAGSNATAQGNGDLLAGCVNWLRGSQPGVTVPGKVINSNSMIIRGSDFTRLAIICCGVIPLILFIGALATWYSRRNK